MKISILGKNRIMLCQGTNELRIEVVPNKDSGFRIYFSPDARLKMPRDLVIGKRKIVII